MAQSNSRETFSSRLGFILAAAGAAVGLGNIWGFLLKRPAMVAAHFYWSTLF